MDTFNELVENGPREFHYGKMEEIMAYKFELLDPETSEMLMAPELRTILAKIIPDGLLGLGAFYIATEWTYKNMEIPFRKIRSAEAQIKKGDKQSLFYGLHEGALLGGYLEKSTEWKDHGRQIKRSFNKMKDGLEDLNTALGTNRVNISYKDFEPNDTQIYRAKAGIARVSESWDKMYQKHLAVRIIGHKLGTARGVLMPQITQLGLDSRKDADWVMAIVITENSAVVKCRIGEHNYYLAGDTFIKTKKSMTIKGNDKGWFIDPCE